MLWSQIKLPQLSEQLLMLSKCMIKLKYKNINGLR